MDLEELLEARLVNSDERLKDRRARQNNLTTREFMLEHVKAGVGELDDTVDPESPEFQTAVILLAAALVIGPNVELLAQFTGYSNVTVAEIARRMRACGLWSDDEVSTEEWFEGERMTATFWTHCLVADGLLNVEQTENGERLYSVAKTH